VGLRLSSLGRAVDTHIAKLRQKIETDPRSPRHIITIHGIGYKFLV
jgi:DNA-binding response OmpR family regulator